MLVWDDFQDGSACGAVLIDLVTEVRQIHCEQNRARSAPVGHTATRTEFAQGAFYVGLNLGACAIVRRHNGSVHPPPDSLSITLTVLAVGSN